MSRRKPAPRPMADRYALVIKPVDPSVPHQPGASSVHIRISVADSHVDHLLADDLRWSVAQQLAEDSITLLQAIGADVEPHYLDEPF